MTHSTVRLPPSSLGAWGLAALTLGLPVQLAAAQEIVLYENDFESPNRAITVDCGNSLDQSGINASYGRPGYAFVEDFTVETVVLHDPAGKYLQPSDRNGEYAIGLLGDVQSDRLALRFDVQSQPFLNLTMDVSSIDVEGCGGPFGIETPVFRISLLDAPDGVFDWNAEKLDEQTLEGEPAPNAWTFAWSRTTAALDARRATDGNVIVVFDVVSQGYAVFDNLRITAARHAAIADRDGDGVTDGSDNCPSQPNGNQANADQDWAGDACDPAPSDPERCGDRRGDGTDDCAEFCETHSVSSCASGAAGSSAAGRAGPGSTAGRGGSPAPMDEDEDAGVEEDRTPPRRWGGGGPTGASEPEETSEGCASAPARGRSTPTAAWWLTVLAMLWLRRRRH